MTVQIQMTPTLAGVPLPAGGNSLGSADVTKDFAGNRFDSYLQTEGNDTSIHITKRDPQGNILDDAVLTTEAGPNGDRKLNSASIMVSGSDLIVVGIGYDWESSPTRINYPMGAIWAGIVTPFPAGMNPELGGGGTIFPQEQTFTDVPPDNTFYPFVQHMASIGAVGGHPCGGPGEPCDAENRPYFRPNDTATRGQICKIVSVATGFNPV